LYGDNGAVLAIRTPRDRLETQPMLKTRPLTVLMNRVCSIDSTGMTFGYYEWITNSALRRIAMARRRAAAA
jgi:hypothetical protein